MRFEDVYPEELRSGDKVWVKSYPLEIVSIEEDAQVYRLTVGTPNKNTFTIPWPKIATIKKINP